MVDPIIKLLGLENMEMNIFSIVSRLLLAAFIGGLIGAERSNKHHSAGLRTNILVCLGSCVAMIVNQYLGLNSDPARLGAAVLTGIGFIGAGAIMVTGRNQIMGLTTAAALWGAGALGLAVGCGFYSVAIVAALIYIISLIFLPKFEAKLKKRSRGYDLHIELYSRPDLKKLIEYIRTLNISIKAVSYDPAYANTGLSCYSLSVFAKGNENEFYRCDELVNELTKLEYVHFVEEI